MFIDESHVTIPQIRGMFAGDRSRKETLVEYGFFMLFGFLSVVHMFMLSILFNAASDDFDKFDDELITHVSVMALLGFLLYYLDLFGF